MLSTIQNRTLSRTIRSAVYSTSTINPIQIAASQISRSFHTTRYSAQLKGPVVGNGDHGTPDETRFKGHYPTIEYSKTMPSSFSAMRHEQILQLCVEGSFSARREALIRNVMAVDSIEYDEAVTVVAEMSKENRKGMLSASIPYHVGMGTALIAGTVSFPMIFDLDTVVAFNEKFVTTDLPDAKDLETYLEVGSFSWGWMEPIIGQISFVLLVLQFARNQALNLGIKPYGDWIMNRRANHLISAYPQYDEMFVRWFSEGETLYGPRYID